MALPAAKKEIEEYRRSAERKLTSDMRKIFGNAEGQNVLRWIMGECGFQSQSVVADKKTQKIYIDSTVYNEARRNLYLQIRGRLPAKILFPVELQPPESANKPITKKGSKP